MKSISASLVFILFAILPVMAQAPQGINYQAIALDAGSNPVSNRSIGLRLSVLDGSPNGTVIYSERQNPSTDNTGLFSIVIGNGIPGTGTFSDINWRNGARWLKTEIDISGGTNYVLMGSSQFMSVPYALYANMSSSSGTFEHPDGLNNITPVMLNDSIPFTVPAGKNLYVNYDFIDIDTLYFLNGTQSGGMTVRPFLGASAGSKVKSEGTGFLVDATVEWKSINIACNPFTVPAGKVFSIITQYTYTYGYALINGKTLRRNISGQILKAGDVLSTSLPCATDNTYYINGYLKSN